MNQVIFLLGDSSELSIPREYLSSSRYFQNLLKASSHKRVTVLLPEWMSLNQFESFIEYLKTGNIAAMETGYYRSLLWVAEYFKQGDLVDILITRRLIPSMDTQMAILLLQDTQEKVKAAGLETDSSWTVLQSAWVEILAATTDISQLQDLEYELQNLILSKILEILPLPRMIDQSVQLFERLLEVRGVKNPVEVYSKEISTAENQSQFTTSVSWNITESLESPKFPIAATFLHLSAQKTESDLILTLHYTCESSLFTKLPCNSLLTGLLRISSSGDESVQPFTMLAGVSKTQTISLGSFRDIDVEDLKIECSVLRYSTVVLNYLLAHPERLNDDHVGGLDPGAMVKLLENDNLAVKSESTALEIACAWIDNRKPENLNEILDLIRWDYVSTPALLNIISSYPYIKSQPAFVELFTDLLKRRSSGTKQSRYPPRTKYTFVSVPTFNIQALARSILAMPTGQREVLKKLERAISNTKKEISSYEDPCSTPSTYPSPQNLTDPFDAMIEEEDVRQNIRCIPGQRVLRNRNSLKQFYR